MNFSYATRINSFKARKDLYDWKYGFGDIRDLFNRVEQVKSLDRIALNYPEHIETPQGLSWLKQRLDDSPLHIEALNSRFKLEDSLYGSISSPDQKTREHAIDLCKKAIDSMRELGSDHFILWLSEDGLDYPFQSNIAELWDNTVRAIAEIADYGKGIKISIEYKPFEPRKVSLVGNLGTTIMAINACGADNVGVTVDYCHLLMGNEYPSIPLVLSASINRLYGVHLNDGFGLADDGLMPGTVTNIQTMEFIYYLLKMNYQGVIYFDTFPIREDPAKECESNIQWTEHLANKMKSLSPKIEAAQKNFDVIALREVLAGMV